jgi:hypothetical protein
MAFRDYIRNNPSFRICPDCGQEAAETEPNSGSYSCEGCGTEFGLDEVNGDGTWKPYEWEEDE